MITLYNSKHTTVQVGFSFIRQYLWVGAVWRYEPGGPHDGPWGPGRWWAHGGWVCLLPTLAVEWSVTRKSYDSD